MFRTSGHSVQTTRFSQLRKRGRCLATSLSIAGGNHPRSLFNRRKRANSPLPTDRPCCFLSPHRLFWQLVRSAKKPSQLLVRIFFFLLVNKPEQANCIVTTAFVEVKIAIDKEHLFRTLKL